MFTHSLVGVSSQMLFVRCLQTGFRIEFFIFAPVCWICGISNRWIDCALNHLRYWFDNRRRFGLSIFCKTEIKEFFLLNYHHSSLEITKRLSKQWLTVRNFLWWWCWWIWCGWCWWSWCAWCGCSGRWCTWNTFFSDFNTFTPLMKITVSNPKAKRTKTKHKWWSMLRRNHNIYNDKAQLIMKMNGIHLMESN